MGYWVNKKLLIYMDKNILKPTGGPIGYNYNLYQEFLRCGYDNIDYVESGREQIEAWKSKIESVKNKRLKKILLVLKRAYKHYILFYGKKHTSYVNLEKYEVVHFHSTLDLFAARDSLKKYRGKVILTSHSPTLLSKEIYDAATWFEKNICGFIYNRLIEIDEYAFNRADYIFFPCEEAEEPYNHAWAGFKELKQRKKDSFKYLISGINVCYAKQNREVIRNKYGIPQDAFLMCYVGRHNEIKGYDLLKSYCGKYIHNHKNSYVIVAGKEFPLKGVDHQRWIEIGWTNDPHSIIAAADVFILPNRETYFDLVLLEALSLGANVIASNTGGNKFFKNKDIIDIFSNEEQFEECLEKTRKMNADEKVIRKNAIIDYFNNYHTISIFAKQYVDLINSLE